MKPFIEKVNSGLIVCVLLIGAMPLAAQDSNTGTTEEKESADNRAGGHLSLGFGYRTYQGPFRNEENEFSFTFDGRYQLKNGIFIEGSSDGSGSGLGNESGNSVALGYNFYNTQKWDLDVLVAPTHGEFEYDVTVNDQTLRAKRSQTFMLGLRSTGYYGDNILQFTLMPVSLNDDIDNGVYASAWLSRHWQLRNWNFNASAGLRYHSEEILNSYWGFPLDDVLPADFPIDSLPTYRAGDGVSAQVQLGASYPISKNWVVDGFLRYTDISDSILDNPVIEALVESNRSRKKQQSEFGIHIKYVF